MDKFKDIKYKIDLRDIKSYFNIKTIFSFLFKKHQLNMIRYNKGFQKMFLLGLKDFKRISNRYKINENNGKGREYIINTNILVFEGEYLNGKRLKGKEYYDDGKLKFEGEYLNGKRLKGKEYYDDGKLEFEGEYSNGKRRKGKEYYDNGKLKFEGEFLDGLKIGKSKKY